MRKNWFYFYCAVDVGFAERRQPDDLWAGGDGREGQRKKVSAGILILR